MGRHGYTDDSPDTTEDVLRMGRWAGMVKSATRGKRGQALLRDMAKALDAMPVKRLVKGSLQTKDGDCCAIGAVCLARGKDYVEHENDDPCDLEELNESLAEDLDVAQCLVQEVEYWNDEGGYKETPEQRWVRMRAWTEKRIKSADGLPSERA